MNEEKITIYGVMEAISKKIPNQEMFVFPETGCRYTYDAFNDKVNEACRSLIAMGVEKGDHVGLWMDSIEEWYILFFACNKIGAISVPINTGFKSLEMGIILKKFDIKHLFMTKGFSGKYPKYIESNIPGMKVPDDSFPELKNIVTIGFLKDNCTSYDDFIKNGACVNTNEVDKYYFETLGEDICIILPTSGTTGMPKGVMLNNAQLVKNGSDIGDRYKLNGHDKMLIQVPMFHCFGITLSMLAALTHCSTMCVISHFKASLAMEVIGNERITCMNGVPTMFIAIRNLPNFNKADFTSLEKCIIAGSTCDPLLMEMVEEDFGGNKYDGEKGDGKGHNVRTISVFGLSEASPGCTMSSVDDSQEVRWYTVGTSLPDVECKIINPETGEECAVGERGEFVVRGYNVMQGYYNDSELTRETFDSDGWLHTGDIAFKKEDGTYEITGRIKDVIIRGGENIYPKEIEMVIRQCPGVIDVCVFGVDSDRFGQEVRACVVTEGIITAADIICFMEDKVAKYKIPEILIVDKLPTTASGKVPTAEVRALYEKICVEEDGKTKTFGCRAS